MTDKQLQDRIAEIGIIRPGDTLIVRLDRPVSMKEIDEYRAHFAAAVPDVPIVFIQAEQALIVQRGVGRCGNHAPTLLAGTVPTTCSLPAEHAGWHRDDMGTEWTERS